MSHHGAMRILPIIVTSFALSGCVASAIASTVVGIATLPVKVASATVDAVTTSQAEADQKRGRDLRKQEEAQGRVVREMQSRCTKGRPLPTDNCRQFQRQP